ncbi:WXG100 family type VII secretion target [Nocardia harenae]|uniref:WXG100 family type VII secretion target n=1 Tax=Nocardia harenae TaxID=358707 RepID=UPI0008356B7A|nr:WXG100 family type VII secretion target [Nocardia harenae]
MSSKADGEILRVVPAEIVDAGQFVQLTADALISGLRSLDGEIGRLLDGWTGSSADAYRAGWTETRYGALTVLESLVAMAELLGVSAENFTDQEQVNSDGIVLLDI